MERMDGVDQKLETEDKRINVRTIFTDKEKAGYKEAVQFGTGSG